MLQDEQLPPQPILSNGGRHYRLDLAGKRITFLDKRFYFTEDGTPVPSVTTVLEAYPKGAGFYKWLKENGEDSDEIRDDAGRRGSNVHNLTEKFDKGEKVSLLTEGGEISMSMAEWAMFERYVSFRARNPHWVPVVIEQNFVSATLGIGGTIDRVFQVGNKRVILDIKTGGSIWPTAWIQVSGYRVMANEAYELADEKTLEALKANYIDEVCILHLNAKTRTDKAMEGAISDCQGKGWQLKLRTGGEQAKDWRLFQATQRLWLAENADAAPREAVYQIEYLSTTVDGEGKTESIPDPMEMTSPSKQRRAGKTL